MEERRLLMDPRRGKVKSSPGFSLLSTEDDLNSAGGAGSGGCPAQQGPTAGVPAERGRRWSLPDPVDLQNGSPSIFSRVRLLRAEKLFRRKRTTEKRKERIEAPGDVSEAELLCFGNTSQK